MNSPEAFYLHIQGEQRGPYTIRHIDHLLNSGLITEDALFWREGLEQWQPVTRLVPRRIRRNPWRIPLACGILAAVLLIGGMFFGPVTVEGWREIYQHDFTQEAAYWRAREVVRSQVIPKGGVVKFADIEESQIQLNGDSGAEVVVKGVVTGANGTQALRWRVRLSYDKPAREWTGVQVGALEGSSR